MERERQYKGGKTNVARGLYAVVQPGGSGSWVQRITINGKRLDKGLGSLSKVTEAQAMAIAADNRAAVKRGENPWKPAPVAVVEAAPVAAVPVTNGEPAVTMRDIETMMQKMLAMQGQQPAAGLDLAAMVSTPTLHDAALRTHRSKVESGQLNNDDVIRSWWARVERHIVPVLGAVQVGMISRRHIVELLEKVGEFSPHEAIRCRSILREVFTDCMEREEIDINAAGEGVANVVKRLRKAWVPTKMRSIGYEEVGRVYVAIANAHRVKKYGRRMSKPVQRALQLLLLTAVRSGEIRGMKWDEIDLQERTWTIPAERMKMGTAHRVPLARPVVRLLRRLWVERVSEYVFVNGYGELLARHTLSQAMRRLDVDTTPHGLRTTFRSWAAEAGYRYEVGETALAHQVGNAVERAYVRVDYLEERRDMMEAWAEYVMEASKAVDVTAILE